MHAMRRGQAEFALILGIVIIAVFVAVFAFSNMQGPGVGPSSLTNEQKAVETYVLDAFEKSSKRTLTYIYKQGGYIDPASENPDAVRFVEFQGNMVPYWQVCQNTYIPRDEKIKADIEKGVREILKNTLPEKTDIAGKIVEFRRNEITVNAIIHTDKVSFEARVPSTIGGQPMDEPYRIDVSSRLGRIIDFAADFSTFQKKYRALDENLMKLVRRSSPPPDDVCWLPTKGLEVEGIYSLLWGDARKCMQQHIEYTLSHTKFWEWSPIEGDHIPEEADFALKYAYVPQIENAAGQWLRYDDLDVTLSYNGAAMPLKRTSNEFMFGSDPDPIMVKPTLIVFFNLPAYYDIKYDVSFPAAVLVSDDFMGVPFRFMTFVNIKGNIGRSTTCNIGDFDDVVESDYTLACETGLNKDVDITLARKGSGQKLPGVYVFFNELCLPWATDGNGKVSGVKAPTMNNPRIDFYDQSSSSTYSVCVANSNALNGLNVQMPIKEDFSMKLYKVDITKIGARYTITDIKYVTGTTGEQVDVEMTRKQSGGCPPPEFETLYTFKNYYHKQVDEEHTVLMLKPDGVIDMAVYEDATVNADPEIEGNNVRFEVEDNYGAKVKVKDYGSVTRDLALRYGVYTKVGGKNRIYVYAPKIISGGYSEADDANLAALYNKCKLPPLSENAMPTYDYDYNPSNPSSTGVKGCWYQP